MALTMPSMVISCHKDSRFEAALGAALGAWAQVVLPARKFALEALMAVGCCWLAPASPPG